MQNSSPPTTHPTTTHHHTKINCWPLISAHCNTQKKHHNQYQPIVTTKKKKKTYNHRKEREREREISNGLGRGGWARSATT